MAADYIFGVFLLTITCCVLAMPCPEEVAVYKQDNCISMTPKREAEIQEIVSKISNYVDDLTLDHESFDIRLIKFAIEKHSPNETGDKDMKIQVIVNDCPGNMTEDDGESSEDPSPEELPLVQPEVMWLDFDNNGEDLLEAIQARRGRKRPLIVYVQSGKQYYILRR